MSDMTPAQRAWLTKLRDEGPQEKRPGGKTAMICFARKWTKWVNSTPYYGRDDYCECITPAGLAALAEAEARDE